MKKRTKIILIVLAVIAVILAGSYIASQIRISNQNANLEKFSNALSECDVEEAMIYARKMNDEYEINRVEELKAFLDLYEAGEWEKAISYYDSFGNNSFTRGKPQAVYCDCYYQQLIPAAEEAGQNGDTVKELEALLQFQNRFHDGRGNATVFKDGSTYCVFSNYKEYYPDNAAHFFDLVCSAGETAIENRNAEAIEMLSGFKDQPAYMKRSPRTYSQKSFSWAEKLTSYEKEVAKQQADMEARRETVFDKEKLKNWNAAAMMETYGVDEIRQFTPSDPQPDFFIVVAEDVINPSTGEISKGGYYSDREKLNPVDTEDLLDKASYIEKMGLTLTDDPDKASFALILTLNYTDNVSKFHPGGGQLSVPVYYATVRAELLNLKTKQSLISKDVIGSPYTMRNGTRYLEEYVIKAVSSIFGPVPKLTVKDFPAEYWEFIGHAELAP